MSSIALFGSDPYSTSVPKTIALVDSIKRDNFFVVSHLYSDSLRFVCRDFTHLHVYAHHGTFMWSKAISLPSTQFGHSGTTSGAADVDGDGEIEVVVLNNSNQILIYDGLTGTLENTWPVSVVLGQIAGHLVIVNLRGEGERDAIIQTIDADGVEGTDYEFYINRSLIAVNLDDGTVIWTRPQDASSANGYYEGYWGQAHGGLICADVDDDGLDEVVGNRLIDDDGSVIDLYANPANYEYWVSLKSDNKYLDHIDAIAVGDFRPDLPGLEWVTCHEDHEAGPDSTNVWTTNMYYYAPIFADRWIWGREPYELFSDIGSKEAQNIAVGNFDNSSPYCEIWNRSRFPSYEEPDSSQHPWIYSYDVSSLMDHYSMENYLPAGFNIAGNDEGLEVVCTIDWDGGEQEYLVGQARHTDSYSEGNVGVFEAKDLTPVWYTGTGGDYASVKSCHIYTADIGGDSREEVIVYNWRDGDGSGNGTLKIYWNDDSPSTLNPVKWNDPLYRRVKQTANYYSPGSYTKRDPVLLRVKILLEGPYDSGYIMKTRLKDYGLIPTTSPYVEDPRIVSSIPDNVVDWILVQLRKTATGNTILSRSAFLRNDGYIITEEDTVLQLFVEEDGYYIVTDHWNHLQVMSDDTVRLERSSVAIHDFTTSSDQFYGSNGTVDLDSGIWGMWAGDGNNDKGVYAQDYTLYRTSQGNEGYEAADYNLDGGVYAQDYTIYRTHQGKESAVPNN